MNRGEAAEGERKAWRRTEREGAKEKGQERGDGIALLGAFFFSLAAIGV